MTKLLLYLSLFNSLACIITCLPATLFGDDPFSVIWNADSKKCRDKFGIEFNFSAYNIEENSGDVFHGDKMVIFYENELGNYPHVKPDGTEINGGIPQLAPLDEHLKAASRDINNVIPNETFPGLAVLDWESWRPLFKHNFDSKEIYQTLSKKLVAQKHANWNKHEITAEAKQEFNEAAKRFMLSTLSRATKLRPNGRWGFYGFPRCYNYHCNVARFANNRLDWMFNASTGLFPSLYLKNEKDSWLAKVQSVHETLQETLRVFHAFSSNETVIVPYVRFRYTDPEHFYDESELLITMAMAALKGSAGVVLWDSSANFGQKKLCEDMERYLTKTLGPFVVTLTNFLKKCSKERCNTQGRCVKTPDALSPPPFYATSRLWRIVTELIRMRYPWWNHWQNVTPLPPTAKASDTLMNYQYTCRCYPGWTGSSCNIKLEA